MIQSISTVYLNPQFRQTLTVINNALGEMTSICKDFQRINLTTIEAFQFLNVKICKIRSRYLEETVHCSDTMKKVLNSIDCDVDKIVILRFVKLLRNHLEKRFPDDELLDWQQFSILYPRNCNLHIFNLTKIQIFSLLKKFSFSSLQFNHIYFSVRLQINHIYF